MTSVTLQLRPFKAWYDLWVGIFVDLDQKRIYWCPIPCFGIVFEWDGPPLRAHQSRGLACEFVSGSRG